MSRGDELTISSSGRGEGGEGEVRADRGGEEVVLTSVTKPANSDA